MVTTTGDGNAGRALRGRPKRFAGHILASVLLLAACSPASGGFSPGPSLANATVDKISGTFYYLGPAGDPVESTEYTVWSWQPGKDPKKLTTGSSELLTSANVSPDGKLLSWVEGAQDGATLKLRDLAQDKDIDTGVFDADPYCLEPVWTDEHTLMYGMSATDPRRAARYDVTTGKTTDVEGIEGCHPRFAPDASDKFAYMGGGLDRVGLVDGDDETELSATVIPGRQITGVTSVAPGNAAVCVTTVGPNEPTGDVARPLGCDTVVDTETKKPIDLPDETATVLFPPTGGFITRAGSYESEFELQLSTQDDEAIDSLSEPPGLLNAHPLRYVPAK